MQDKILQQHKLVWQNHIYSKWEILEQTLQQSTAHKKKNKELKGKLLLMFELEQKLLVARKPSLNYSLFLTERLAFFQMKAIKDGRPHQVLTSEQFVKMFVKASTSDQHLLCELYLHNEVILENKRFILTLLLVTFRLGHLPLSLLIKLHGRLFFLQLGIMKTTTFSE